MPSKCLKGEGLCLISLYPLGPSSAPCQPQRLRSWWPTPHQCRVQQGPLGCGIPVLPSCSQDHQGMAEQPLESQGNPPHGGATGPSPGHPLWVQVPLCPPGPVRPMAAGLGWHMACPQLRPRKAGQGALPALLLVLSLSTWCPRSVEAQWARRPRPSDSEAPGGRFLRA